ncbi:MAG: aldehyde ferredoxin oxidoreductase family protein [candidate division KSB1 bacterium]|nr:aldehyde ferredoxin oxidoreductase family protein [candidate division KSB1 bacterium]
MPGWMGRVVRVDLSSGAIQEEPFEERTWRRFLGGRGFGAKVLWDELRPGIDPFSPDNRLIFAVGPLTGTTAATSGRASVSTKSPLTGTITDANTGGKFGVIFKKAGLDALIIQGKAAKPVYILVSDEGIEIKDASDLWGRLTDETTELLLQREGARSSVACIGPAGENLVRFAAIINEKHRAFARGGVGAVMGSKNLKAVVARGLRTVEIADKERMKFVTYEANKWLRAHPITSKGLPEFGTSVLVNIMNEAGVFPAYNFRQNQFEHAEEVSGEAITERILVRKDGCWGCIIQCARRTRIPGDEGEGPEYESNWALGPNCGIHDLEVITRANYLCNRLGIDTMSAGGTISCAMEMTELGYYDAGIRFGEGDKLLEYLRKIAYRDGVGDELAEGSLRFATRHGHPELSMTVKGQELAAYDPRGAQGQGLAYATTNRGGCHLRGGYLIGRELLGVPRMIDRFSAVGKGSHTAILQNLGAALDSLVVCRFASFALNEIVWGRLLTAVTGVQYDPEDVLEAGDRIFNLERMFNVREGFRRKDDTLPPRLLQEPAPMGPAKGRVVELDRMLDEFYEFRGWDQDGVPTPETLRRLGLEECLNG